MRVRLFLVALVLPVMAACGGGDDDGDASSADTTCEYVQDGEAAKEAKLPPTEPRSVESMVVRTNRGDITLTFTPETAPCTVNSFVSLAEQGYFDGTKC